MYPIFSPYSSVDNSPLNLIDGDGRVITIPTKDGSVVYTPGMDKTKLDATAVAHANDLDALYASDKFKSGMDKLSASKVEYFVMIGDAEFLNHPDPKWNSGETKFDFQGDNPEGSVGLLISNASGDGRFALLGDELTTAMQFENGDIGFKVRERSGGDQFEALANDLEDEIVSKIGAVNAIHAIGKKVSDFKDQLGKYESFSLMLLIEKNGGKLSDQEKSDWLKNSPGYCKDITGNNANPGVQTKPKSEVGTLSKKTKYAYREEGKTIIKK